MKKLLIIFLMLAGSVTATTYYVADSTNTSAVADWGSVPSDGDAGTSWATAWASVTKVNATLAAGDTVYFSTGLWLSSILEPTGGTYSDRTCYACSSFALQNGDGDYHFAQIWNSDTLQGWTLYSGNIYRTLKPAVETGEPSFLMQNDSIMKYFCDYTTGLAAVNVPGEYYYDTSATSDDYIYVYVHNLGGLGQDPDAYNMQFAYNDVVELPDGEHYITFWGLHFSHGNGKIVDVGSTGADMPDSIFFEHCKFSYAIDDEANCSFIRIGHASATDTTVNSEWWIVRACTLLNAYEQYAGSAGAMVFYSTSHILIESCFVGGMYGYNFNSAAFNFKGQTLEALNKFNTVRYNIYRPDRGPVFARFWSHTYHDSCYGNIIDGRTGLLGTDARISRSIIGGGESDIQVGESVFVFNNTIYNTKRGFGLIDEHYQVNSHTYQRGIVCKYNVFYNNMTYTYVSDLVATDPLYDTVDVAPVDMDSNLYIYPSGVADQFEHSGTNYTFSGWQTISGRDLHSTNNVDPGFTDAANGDFTRAAASGEMDRTYGDRRWTIYGALQNTLTIYVATSIIDVTNSSLNIVYNLTGRDSALTDSIVIFGSTTDSDPNDGDDRIGVSTQIPADTTAVTGLSPASDYWARHIAYWTESSGDVADTSDVVHVVTGGAAPADKSTKYKGGVYKGGYYK